MSMRHPKRHEGGGQETIIYYHVGLRVRPDLGSTKKGCSRASCYHKSGVLQMMYSRLVPLGRDSESMSNESFSYSPGTRGVCCTQSFGSFRMLGNTEQHYLLTLSLASQTLTFEKGLVQLLYTTRFCTVSSESPDSGDFEVGSTHRLARLAHSVPPAGHLGKAKTGRRIQQRFYWGIPLRKFLLVHPSLVDGYPVQQGGLILSLSICPQNFKILTTHKQKIPSKFTRESFIAS